MSQEGTHRRAKARFELTPRQQEVLEFLARGWTNAEIASALGLSLDGVKWHVREILAKLHAESREQAVEAWRAHQSAAGRARRALSAVAIPGATLRWGAAALAGGAAIATGIAIVFGVAGGGHAEAPADEAALAESRTGAGLAPCATSQIELSLSITPAAAAHVINARIVNHGAPCHLARQLVFEVLDPGGGRLTGIFANPDAIPVDIDVGAVLEAPAFAWENWCQAGEFRLQLTMGPWAATTIAAAPPCGDPSSISQLRSVPGARLFNAGSTTSP